MKRGRDAGPRAREVDLLVHELQGETVVYDLTRHEGHCLNRSARLVWEACDGETPVAAIATRVGRELGQPVDGAFVRFALRRLERAHLLRDPLGEDTGPLLSRRVLAKRLGLLGALSVLLPAVVSIVAPTAAQAATACSPPECHAGRFGCCCTNNRLCENSGGGRGACSGNRC